MKKYRCRFPNCGTLLDSPGFCSKHKEQSEKLYGKPFETASRSNEDMYHSSRWQQLKNIKLKESPTCELCGEKNDLQIHHITPPRGNEQLFFEYSNLMTVCINCHRKITAKEIQKRGNND